MLEYPSLSNITSKHKRHIYYFLNSLLIPASFAMTLVICYFIIRLIKCSFYIWINSMLTTLLKILFFLVFSLMLGITGYAFFADIKPEQTEQYEQITLPQTD